MDFDLEIISEEGDRPDPLFDSIMNAMNSMKEATADKIYQKIQKEGATNYSKPQVDRALASALKYGIFEVKNNRYRVRDDALDDEDTVYWKFQKKRDQTPFRIQEDVNEKHTGPKLDPEKDNQRFRKPMSPECPHCGRMKRPAQGSKSRKKTNKKSRRKPRDTKRHRNTHGEPSATDYSVRKAKRRDTSHDDQSPKRRKSNSVKASQPSETEIQCSDETMMSDLRKDITESQDGTSDSSDSDMEVLTGPGNKYLAYTESKGNPRNRNKTLTSAFSSDCIKADLASFKLKRSSISIKTESESEKETYMSSVSDEPSQTGTTDGFFEQRPCTSKNTTGKIRNQYLHSVEMYKNQYERGQTDNNEGNSDWLGCSDEPQGAIIQSNNVLTIEPMDSLSFKNPEQASYIS